MNRGKEAALRLARIADAASGPGPGVTRLPFSSEHSAAVEIMKDWMTGAGLKVHIDPAGTLIGRRDGPAGAPTLLFGSHQDSVPGGGAFDGIMGIALACLALETLRSDTLSVAAEVLAFAHEEGVRFPTALIGPRALAGTLDPEVFDLVDADGTRLREALERFGGRPCAIDQARRSRADILGYVELHIEQGPVLEAMDQPLGIVTAICGIERHKIRFRGTTGHAGTVPMDARHDALVAASRFVAEVPGMAASWPGLRATVGTMTVRPNAPNAIPEDVSLVLEVRSESDADRKAAATALVKLASHAADLQGCDVAIDRTYEQPAVLCDPALSARLADAANHDLPRLPSGATHDASAMADLCPIAMLFVRCRGGVSHRPDEFASPADMGAAVNVIAGLLSGYREDSTL
ncbi:MAG: M20 family metallo-hydrolase [Pseudomonadota bacterium]